MAKTSNATNILAQIQNLSAEEQGDIINAMRMLEVNAQDEQYFTNVTKAMQAAGWNPVKRATAGVRAAMNNRMEATKGINSRKTARALRLFGMRKSADFIDRWLTSSPKKKLKPGKVPSQGSSSASTGSGNSDLVGIKKQLNHITVAVDTISEDVMDIKSILLPKGIAAKNKRGDTQFVQFNPLAPPGEQFNRVTESGKLTAIKPGKEFQQSAQKRAALATAQLALKIIEKDRASAELRKKYSFKEEEEKYRGAGKEDCAEGLREDMKEGFKDVEEKIEESTSGGLIGKIFKFALPALLPILAEIGKLGIVGIVALIANKVGEALWEKFTNWWDDDKILKPMMDLSDKLRDRMVKLGILKSDEEYAAEEAKNAAAGRMRGGVASTGGKSMAENIAALEAQLRAEKNPERRAALQTAIDSLKQHMPKRGSGPTSRSGPRPQTIPAEMADSDTVDTNYANVPQAPKITPPPPSTPAVGGTGTLTGSTYEQRVKALGDVIASGESKGDYNVFNMGKGHGYKQQREDLSKMTIAEFLRRGNLPSKDPQKMFATGKYQIIPDTMKDAVRTLGLNPNSTLTPAMQEHIFKEYLTKSRRPKIHNYLTGKSNDFNAAVTEMAKEWASVGVPQAMQGQNRWVQPGESYYAGDGINKAHTSPETISSVLTPAPTIPGSTLDKETRAYQASNMGSGGVTVVNAPTVNNTKVNNTVGKRPAQKADVLTQDKSLVRTVNRDAQHPVHG